jgi:hypothetical protein
MSFGPEALHLAGHSRVPPLARPCRSLVSAARARKPWAPGFLLVFARRCSRPLHGAALQPSRPAQRIQWGLRHQPGPIHQAPIQKSRISQHTAAHASPITRIGFGRQGLARLTIFTSWIGARGFASTISCGRHGDGIGSGASRPGYHFDI